LPLFQGHTDWVFSVTFDSTGEQIISGGLDGTLRIWDLNGTQIGSTLEGNSSASIFSVACSPTGKHIVSSDGNGELRLWDLDKQNLIRAFSCGSQSIHTVAFSPSGERIVSGDSNGILYHWDLAGNQIRQEFIGHTGPVTSIVFSPAGKYIISSGADGILCLWDLKGNQIGKPFTSDSGLVSSVTFSPTGNYIISGHIDGKIHLWRGGDYYDWLQGCCNTLMYHSELVSPQTDYAQRACQVCLDRVWTKAEQARFHRAQGYHLQRQGDPAAAQAKFAQAHQLDPSLEIE
jgi:WD40 repeat protein